MDGWALQGALNLNNEIENKPNWKDIDGVKELTFDPIEFNDGRKDGKEGTANGAQSNEKNADRLNPVLVENHYADVASNYSFGDETKKNIGVTKKAKPLFKCSEGVANEDSFFYVIPRDNNEPVNMTIVYDVETIDKNLASYLSDGATHGISIENKISKEAVLGAGTDIEAGKQYLFLIHIGMTSVKVEAIVTDWYDNQNTIIDLPDNQPQSPYWTVAGIPGFFTENPATVGVTFTPTLVKNEATFNSAIQVAPWKLYYEWCDSKDAEPGIDYRWAASGRYNATTDKTASESGLSYRSAADWEAAGYMRCWKGAQKDGKWPIFGIDLADNPIIAETKVEYDINNGETTGTFPAAWTELMVNKIAANKPYFIVSVVESGDLNKPAYDIFATDPIDITSLTLTYKFPQSAVTEH
jgi:hypothetical protein